MRMVPCMCVNGGMCVPAEQKCVLSPIRPTPGEEEVEGLKRRKRAGEGEFDETQNKTCKGKQRKEREL